MVICSCWYIILVTQSRTHVLVEWMAQHLQSGTSDQSPVTRHCVVGQSCSSLPSNNYVRTTFDTPATVCTTSFASAWRLQVRAIKYSKHLLVTTNADMKSDAVTANSRPLASLKKIPAGGGGVSGQPKKPGHATGNLKAKQERLR